MKKMMLIKRKKGRKGMKEGRQEGRKKWREGGREEGGKNTTILYNVWQRIRIGILLSKIWWFKKCHIFITKECLSSVSSYV